MIVLCEDPGTRSDRRLRQPLVSLCMWQLRKGHHHSGNLSIPRVSFSSSEAKGPQQWTVDRSSLKTMKQARIVTFPNTSQALGNTELLFQLETLTFFFLRNVLSFPITTLLCFGILVPHKYFSDLSLAFLSTFMLPFACSFMHSTNIY